MRVRTAGSRLTVVALLIGASVGGFAETAWAASAAVKDAAPTHATRGIVQAIDARTMVIARSGDRGRMTFSLTPTTLREDTIVVGATVSVRFRDVGQRHIATAVALQRAAEHH